MIAACRMALLVIGAALASAAHSGDPFGKDWPEGPNREITGAFCGSCHSLALVKQQRQSRAGWDKLMTWMTKTQNMPEVAPALRIMMLDYLEANFGLDDESAVESVVDSEHGAQGVALPPLIESSD